MSQRIRLASNVPIEQAITAIARAHMRYPGVDLARAKDLAAAIDRVMTGHMGAECTIALCIQLLRTLGVHEPGNESRFRDQ